MDPFTDVRTIESELESAGLQIDEGVDPTNAEGPAHIRLTDPDGNPVLIDQYR